MPQIEQVRDACIGYLQNIEQFFVPEAKLTLIVRVLGNAEADWVLTTDTEDEIIAVMERTKGRKEWIDQPSPPPGTGIARECG